jgi:transcriptional regulator with XRE-family HTH domain
LNLRKNLGYSREYVSRVSGVNADTIRKIENGDVLPRFETLELLSLVYKVNLLQLLDQCKSNTTITHFYDSIDYYIARDDISEIHRTTSDFLLFSNEKRAQLLWNPNEMKQLSLFFEAIDLLYSEDSHKYDRGLALLIDAMKVTINTFALENWHAHLYNQLELRLLYCMASILIHLDHFQTSIDILQFMLERFDFTGHANLNEKFTIIKTYSLISYNYHMLDNHEKSLEFANIGIEYSQKNALMHHLPLLLSRKGVALYNLKNNDFKKYLDQAVQLLMIQENYNLANLYIEINSKLSKQPFTD